MQDLKAKLLKLLDVPEPPPPGPKVVPPAWRLLQVDDPFAHLRQEVARWLARQQTLQQAPEEALRGRPRQPTPAAPAETPSPQETSPVELPSPQEMPPEPRRRLLAAAQRQRQRLAEAQQPQRR
jgi:hypothetical protein